MILSRKKTFILVIAIMLGSFLLFLCSAKPSTDEPESENSTSKPNPTFRNDSDYLNKTSNETSTGSLIFRFIVSVLFLIAFGVGGIYISKRFLPKITNMSEKEIRIIETVHLGPRKAVHLLEIGERRFLIGSTNENITRLADLTSAFTEV